MAASKSLLVFQMSGRRVFEIKACNIDARKHGAGALPVHRRVVGVCYPGHFSLSKGHLIQLLSKEPNSLWLRPLHPSQSCGPLYPRGPGLRVAGPPGGGSKPSLSWDTETILCPAMGDPVTQCFRPNHFAPEGSSQLIPTQRPLSPGASHSSYTQHSQTRRLTRPLHRVPPLFFQMPHFSAVPTRPSARSSARPSRE